MTDKELVARLIILVLTNKITVREAILRFPKNSSDKNIVTAYHALVHYEADENQRLFDADFREEQDNYLTMIAELLASNKDLPKNIVKCYESYYPEIELPKSDTIRNAIKHLCKFLNVK